MANKKKDEEITNPSPSDQAPVEEKNTMTNEELAASNQPKAPTKPIEVPKPTLEEAVDSVPPAEPNAAAEPGAVTTETPAK